MGLLFDIDKKDQPLRIPYDPDNKESAFLWYFIYDTGTVSVTVSIGSGAFCRSGLSAEYFVLRTGGFCALFRHLEFCCEAAGACQNEYLYLSGSYHNCGGFCFDPAGTVYMDDRGGNSSDIGRTAFVRRQIFPKNICRIKEKSSVSKRIKYCFEYLHFMHQNVMITPRVKGSNWHYATEHAETFTSIISIVVKVFFCKYH